MISKGGITILAAHDDLALVWRASAVRAPTEAVNVPPATVYLNKSQVVNKTRIMMTARVRLT